MNALFAVLLHGDEMDIIYFWSSIFMILLPITIFSVLTYLIVKGYKNREKGEGRST
jgi:hypothetical protein